MNNQDKIDFIIYWVDGNDPDWQREYGRYKTGHGQDAGVRRYRDWENLQYWFRGVEKYAPWVNRIYFVTWGHVPKWLDTDHPKIEIVRHTDFIPGEYLPTFSANPIELNFHRIKGLEEHFVVFNDDFFITNQVKPQDFFRDGKPVDILMEYPVMCGGNVPVFSGILVNDFNLIGKYFDRREYTKRLKNKILTVKYGKYLFYNLLLSIIPYPRFFGILTPHFARPYLKSVYEEVWKIEGEELDRVCRNRFRDSTDLNIYIFRLWNLLKGNFVPGNIFKMGKMIPVAEDSQEIIRLIEDQRYKLICLNDECGEKNFETVKAKIIDSFDGIFPEKSSFEK